MMTFLFKFLPYCADCNGSENEHRQDDEDCFVKLRNNFELTKEELKIIYELLEHQYISYENVPAINLIRKIQGILNED